MIISTLTQRWLSLESRLSVTHRNQPTVVWRICVWKCRRFYPSELKMVFTLHDGWSWCVLNVCKTFIQTCQWKSCCLLCTSSSLRFPYITLDAAGVRNLTNLTASLHACRSLKVNISNILLCLETCLCWKCRQHLVKSKFLWQNAACMSDKCLLIWSLMLRKSPSAAPSLWTSNATRWKEIRRERKGQRDSGRKRERGSMCLVGAADHKRQFQFVL